MADKLDHTYCTKKKSIIGLVLFIIFISQSSSLQKIIYIGKLTICMQIVQVNFKYKYIIILRKNLKMYTWVGYLRGFKFSPPCLLACKHSNSSAWSVFLISFANSFNQIC